MERSERAPGVEKALCVYLPTYPPITVLTGPNHTQLRPYPRLARRSKGIPPGPGSGPVRVVWDRYGPLAVPIKDLNDSDSDDCNAVIRDYDDDSSSDEESSSGSVDAEWGSSSAEEGECSNDERLNPQSCDNVSIRGGHYCGTT